MNANDILIKVCCDVFESLSFMFGEAIDLDEVDSESESFINVSIPYKGDRAGAIILIVSAETAKILVIIFWVLTRMKRTCPLSPTWTL
jgi:hypothetical protein